jgi:hypothetical protein
MGHMYNRSLVTNAATNRNQARDQNNPPTASQKDAQGQHPPAGAQPPHPQTPKTARGASQLGRASQCISAGANVTVLGVKGGDWGSLVDGL